MTNDSRLTTGIAKSERQSQRQSRRIVYFDHIAKMSGGEIALFNLVRSLDQEKVEPIIVLGESGPLAQNFSDIGVQVHVLPMSVIVRNTRKDSLGFASLLKVKAIVVMMLYAVRLARLLKQLKPDLVHANSLKSDVIGFIAARIAGIPIIWHLRDRIAADYLPGMVARCFRWFCSWAPDFIIANSAATLATVVEHSEDQNNKVAVVHDGVFIHEALVHGPREPRQSKFVVGMIGRISPWKGQHIFIQAVSNVRSEFPDAEFWIVGAAMFGECDYEVEIKDMVSRLGLDDCIKFLGFRSPIQAVLAELDIVVHASTVAEPFGQVVAEAMAAGKPVIATRGGGVSEIVTEGTGLLVSMNSVDELAAALRLLLKQPVLAENLARAARERIKSEFSITRHARAVEDIYEMFPNSGTAQILKS